MNDISVIVPCRNAEPWIAQTIRSALAQYVPPREIIVVDDGSTDRSVDVAEGMGAHVRVIQESGRGASAARRRGAQEAAGRFLMFLDADDLLTPDTLGALSRALEEAAEPAVALCPWDRYEAVQGLWVARPATNAPAAPWADALSAWLRDAWSPPCAVLWSRAGYEVSGGWLDAPVTAFDDDGELMRRAFARGVRAMHATEGLALYRRLPESLSSGGRTAEGAVAAVAALEALLEELERSGGPGRHRAAFVAAADAAAKRSGAGHGCRTRLDALISRAGGRHPTDTLRRRANAAAARARKACEPRFTAPFPETPAPLRGTFHSAGTDPLVSVVIPTHQRPALTVAAVKSALAQTWPTIEVIVVDDASADDTPDRVRAICDPRLRVIEQPENRGVAAARNAGLSAARGELIAFLDSDDLWRPDKLARQVLALSGRPANVGICQCGSETRTGDNGTSVHRPGAEGRLFGALLLRNVLHGGGSTVMIRREVIDTIGGFDEELPAAEDWEFFQRASRLFDVISVPEPLAVIRDDAPGPRRSLRFRANMAAREAIFRRNRHALRRARTAHLFLVDSARREIDSTRGSARRGAVLALRALSERPVAPSVWARVAYTLAPSLLRTWVQIVKSRQQRNNAPPKPAREIKASAGSAATQDGSGSR